MEKENKRKYHWEKMRYSQDKIKNLLTECTILEINSDESGVDDKYKEGYKLYSGNEEIVKHEVTSVSVPTFTISLKLEHNTTKEHYAVLLPTTDFPYSLYKIVYLN